MVYAGSSHSLSVHVFPWWSGAPKRGAQPRVSVMEAADRMLMQSGHANGAMRWALATIIRAATKYVVA
jgi:hypothetical protein